MQGVVWSREKTLSPRLTQGAAGCHVEVFIPWKAAVLQIRLCVFPPPLKKLIVKYYISTPLEKLHLGDKLYIPELCKKAPIGVPVQGACAPHSFHNHFPGLSVGSSDTSWT